MSFNLALSDYAYEELRAAVAAAGGPTRCHRCGARSGSWYCPPCLRAVRRAHRSSRWFICLAVVAVVAVTLFAAAAALGGIQ